jgi:hypothetical protein
MIALKPYSFDYSHLMITHYATSISCFFVTTIKQSAISNLLLPPNSRENVIKVVPTSLQELHPQRIKSRSFIDAKRERTSS